MITLTDDGSWKFETRIWEGESFKLLCSTRDMPLDCYIHSEVLAVKNARKQFRDCYRPEASPLTAPAAEVAPLVAVDNVHSLLAFLLDPV